jgi:hypothetical protein
MEGELSVDFKVMVGGTDMTQRYSMITTCDRHTFDECGVGGNKYRVVAAVRAPLH